MNDTPETDKFLTDWMQGVTRDLPNFVEIARQLERERDEAREEFHKASVEANALATSIQKAEYSDAKEFELLGSVAGVISQIDNMYAGVRQQRDEARAVLSEIANASHFDNIGNWARNKAKKALDNAK